MSDTTPTTCPGTTLTDRRLIRVAGEDVRGFLQGLVTQDVVGLTRHAPRWAGLLTPQGKALFDFILWAEGEAVLIDAEVSQAEALARRLAMYRLRRAITIEPVEGLAVHWSAGASADTDGQPHDPRLAELGRRWLAPAAEAASGWTAHRLALGVTEGVGELGAGETLWLECNARELNGVSFTKGCYVGQENTRGCTIGRRSTGDWSSPLGRAGRSDAGDLSRAGADGGASPRRGAGRCGAARMAGRGAG